jgi:hypothetical protein
MRGCVGAHRIGNRVALACLLLSVTAASAADAQFVHGVAVDQSSIPTMK